MHIGLEPGAVGRYVFLPGSPERTEKIAAYFDDPKEIAYNREFRTFVGELDGVKVAVTSTPGLAVRPQQLRSKSCISAEQTPCFVWEPAHPHREKFRWEMS